MNATQQALFDAYHEPANLIAAPPPITPRDYQSRAIANCFRVWDEGNTGAIIRQPTGTGKTVVGAMIASRWLARGSNHRVLCICDQRQLVWQMSEEIRSITGEEVSIEMADHETWGNPRITVACRPTLADRTRIVDGEVVGNYRLQKFSKNLNWLVIWDEAHKHAYSLQSVRHIVDWFGENPNSRRLGLTATPERTDKKSLERMFPAIAEDYRLWTPDESEPCAVRDGWAVPYDQRYVLVKEINFKEIGTLAGDFRKQELRAVLEERKLLAKMVDPTLELVGNRRAIVFNVSVDLAKAVAHYINAQVGDRVADSLDGTVPEDMRQVVYGRHKRGDLQFLSVCGLCREAYNDPGIQAVVILRPTKSKPLAEQMKGRGCRPLKGVVDGLQTAVERRAAIAASDKPDCLIVDLVGATGLGGCASTAAIYASAEPDEVIEEADRLLVERGQQGRPASVADAIEDAKENIRERRKAEERERAERAKRLSEIKTDVKWTQQRVDQAGRGLRQERLGEMSPTMPWGKYAGARVDQLPSGYIAWGSIYISHSRVQQWLQKEAKRRIREEGDDKLRKMVWKHHYENLRKSGQVR